MYDGLGAFDSLDPGTSEEINNSRIALRWGTLLPQMLMAGSDAEVDALIQDFKDTRAANNYDEIMAVRNEKLRENKARLDR